ncbi:MAG TPA: ABC transporter ATP-binding protein [Candidatus Limnocylindria bacterium]|nr:ABC transporter ATP-binding protein [Candidatus Limnocylindria bacterium]
MTIAALPEKRTSIALSCRGLFKRYPPDVVAVNGLDLEVRSGECFGLLGPNGAGKTTTIEIFEGLNQADRGEVTILGQRWGAGQDLALRERLGIQLQETRLHDKLSVEETVRLFRSFYQRGPTTEQVLRMVALEEKRRAWVSKLSGGQKQRLSVACALVNDPELLFLDEPTTGLDPQSRRQLWELIDDFRRRGGTILMTTHYMDEAERLCDRVAIVDHGRVIALGTPAELIALLGAEHVVEFSTEGQLELDAVLRLPGVTQGRREAGGYALTVREVHVTVPALLEELHRQQIGLARLTTHHATLEDVFVSLTGRTLRDE